MFKTLQDMFKRYRRPGDIVFACLFFALSLFLLSQIGEQTAWKNTRLFSQPAFWPAVSLSFMCLFAALHLFGSIASPRIEGRWKEVWFWARSLEYVAWFLGYVILVPLLGYLVATVLFSICLAFRLNYRSPKWLGTSALTAFGIVLTFKTFLQVKVPGGAIYEFLPTALRSFMLTNF
ncbi:MAG: tripartite tricarboxylate transporter TctB family protein [Rhizobiaceae bacterium]